MKSVGEVMAIGRTFKEALQKGLRGLETGVSGFARTDLDDARIKEKLLTPDPDRIFYVKRALDLGWAHDEIFRMTGIDPWFLDQLQQIVDLEKELVTGIRRELEGISTSADARQLSPQLEATGSGGAGRLPWRVDRPSPGPATGSRSPAETMATATPQPMPTT
jgi:hypothetical protein